MSDFTPTAHCPLDHSCQTSSIRGPVCQLRASRLKHHVSRLSDVHKAAASMLGAAKWCYHRHPRSDFPELHCLGAGWVMGLVLLLNIPLKFDAAKSLQSCPTLCDPIDGSPPGSPSLGFSRQEHWSGLPFPSPMHKVKSESEAAQSCPTPGDPMDCSLPGSSIHGIFQARVLEWDAIAFSRNLMLVSTFW